MMKKNTQAFHLILAIMLFLCGFSSYCFGQATEQKENVIILSGQVISKVDGKAIPGVTIGNQTSKKGTVSDGLGEFLIRISVGDTVTFTTLGYETVNLPISDTIAASASKDEFIQVAMEEKTYELESVNVTAYRDAESFKKAILNLELPEEETPKKISIPGSYDGPRKPPQASGPISFITSKIGKKARFEKKLREIREDYKTDQAVRAKFNRDLVEELTGLHDAELDDFMLYCKLEDKFILNSNEYDIVIAVDKCYSEFQKSTKD